MASGANSFIIPQTGPVVSPQQQQGRGARVPQFSVDPRKEALYHVEGQMDKYYMQANALEGFAKMAYDKYGIDVTQPSFGNPHAMTLHKIFLKGIASVQQQGNQFRNAQAMAEQMMSNPNFSTSMPKDRLFDYNKDVVNLQLDDIIKERNTLAGKDYTTQEAERFNQQQAQLQQAYLQQAEKLRQAGNIGQAEYYERNAQGIQFAQASAQEEAGVNLLGEQARTQQTNQILDLEQAKTQGSMRAENYAQADNARASAEYKRGQLAQLQQEVDEKADDPQQRLEMLERAVGRNGAPEEELLGAFLGGNIKNSRLVMKDSEKGPRSRPPAPGEEYLEDKPEVKEIQLEVTEKVRELIEGNAEELEKDRVVYIDKDRTVRIDISTPEKKKKAIQQLNNIYGKLTGKKIPAEDLMKLMDEQEGGQVIDLGFD